MTKLIDRATDYSYGSTSGGYRAEVRDEGELVLTARDIEWLKEHAQQGLLSDWADAQRIYLQRYNAEGEPLLRHIDHAEALRHIMEALAVPIFLDELEDPADVAAIHALVEGDWPGFYPEVAAVLAGDVVAATLVGYLEGPHETRADLDMAIEARSYDYRLASE